MTPPLIPKIFQKIVSNNCGRCQHDHDDHGAHTTAVIFSIDCSALIFSPYYLNFFRLLILSAFSKKKKEKKNKFQTNTNAKHYSGVGTKKKTNF